MHPLQFKIDQMRKQNMTSAIESIAVFLLAIATTIYLPSLLIQYVYANQQLTAEPALLTYIPLVSYGIATLFFLYAMINNIMRMMKIKSLEKELELVDFEHDGCNCDHDHDHDHHEHVEMFDLSEAMDDEDDEEIEVVTTTTKSKPTRKSAAKKKGGKATKSRK